MVFDDASRLLFENREKGGVCIETGKLKHFDLRFFLIFLLIARKKEEDFPRRPVITRTIYGVPNPPICTSAKKENKIIGFK